MSFFESPSDSQDKGRVWCDHAAFSGTASLVMNWRQKVRTSWQNPQRECVLVQHSNESKDVGVKVSWKSQRKEIKKNSIMRAAVLIRIFNIKCVIILSFCYSLKKQYKYQVTFHKRSWIWNAPLGCVTVKITHLCTKTWGMEEMLLRVI